MKYVMFAYTLGDFQRLFPIFFPEALVHAEVAEAIRHMKIGTKDRWVRPVPVSAGNWDPESGDCFGKSTSLGMEAHEEDELVCRFPQLGGIGFAPREEVKGLTKKQV